MTTANASLPTSRRILCGVYGLIAVAALIATWSQNLAYVDEPARFLVDFVNDANVTPAARSLTVDLLLLGLAVTILMVVEARRWGVKFVWLYALGSILIAISVTFPLFLIAREIKMGTSDAPPPRSSDTVLLTVVAVLVLAATVWIDIG